MAPATKRRRAKESTARAPISGAHALEAQTAKRLKNGDRFNSRIFVLSVGPGHKEYAVHETCLRKSPVFARMCEGRFKEGHEQRILLPEEDPTDLSAIVEYLYMDNFLSVGNLATSSSRQACATELASLYVAAEKYGLDALKVLIVEKLKSCTNLVSPNEWLGTAEFIYSWTPSTDKTYPMYLRSLIIDVMSSKSGWPDPRMMDEIEQCLEKGGRLAMDINRACNTYWIMKLNRRAHAFKKIRLDWEKEEIAHCRAHPRCRRSCFKSYNTNRREYVHFEETVDENWRVSALDDSTEDEESIDDESLDDD